MEMSDLFFFPFLVRSSPHLPTFFLFHGWGGNKTPTTTTETSFLSLSFFFFLFFFFPLIESTYTLGVPPFPLLGGGGNNMGFNQKPAGKKIPNGVYGCFAGYMNVEVHIRFPVPKYLSTTRRGFLGQSCAVLP